MTHVQPPVLEVTDLEFSVSAPKRRGRGRGRLNIVRKISLTVGAGETLAIVGESGSGKSTLARALMHLVTPTGGTVSVSGQRWCGLNRKQEQEFRRKIQMVFQDPYSSLDPTMLVADSVAEPLRVHSAMNANQRRARVRELFELVGLASHHLDRNPYEFSGGQRQRIAIARALILDPDVLICDEAVSALDVSTQNQIIGLLEKLQVELGVAYLFISHDLAVVRHIANRIAVMYFGRIVEMGEVEQVFTSPRHPYTAALLGSVPIANPTVQRARSRVSVSGEVPDLTEPPAGCSFFSRCGSAKALCKNTPPTPVEIDGVSVECHFPLSA